ARERSGNSVDKQAGHLGTGNIGADRQGVIGANGGFKTPFAGRVKRQAIAIKLNVIRGLDVVGDDGTVALPDVLGDRSHWGHPDIVADRVTDGPVGIIRMMQHEVEPLVLRDRRVDHDTEIRRWIWKMFVRIKGLHIHEVIGSGGFQLVDIVTPGYQIIISRYGLLLGAVDANRPGERYQLGLRFGGGIDQTEDIGFEFMAERGFVDEKRRM